MMGPQLCECTKIHCIAHFKGANVMICELCVDPKQKTKKKKKGKEWETENKRKEKKEETGGARANP